MNSFSTFSTSSLSVPIQSPPTSLSSGVSEVDTPNNRWKRSPTFDLFEPEFGEIKNFEHSEPFVIKFYYINQIMEGENWMRGDLVCQIDDYIEVPIHEAIKCLECVRDDRILLEALHIEIIACDVKSKSVIENILKKFVERRNRCKELIMVKRLVFFIFDFTYARDFAPILSIMAPRPFEVNIGIDKRAVYSLSPSTESSYVAEFLHSYLQPKKTWEIVRVLRIYNFIRLDTNFQNILNQCKLLRHLTLSNIDEIELFEVHHVHSVLLDGCDMGYTKCDFEFAKKLPRLFPNATSFGFLRCKLEIAIKALEQFSGRRIGDDRMNLNFYQPERDFRRFLYLTTNNFEIVNDDNELEGEVQIQGHNSGPIITVFNKDRIYKAGIGNS